MTKIVAGILTKNAAKHLADCLETVSWVDSIVVEDGFSDDETITIAESYKANIFQNQFVNFSISRNNVLNNAKKIEADWLLFVDPDERITPELATEIETVVTNQAKVGWWIPRYNDMWGHRMRGGGWYPDYQLRLLKVGAARYDPQREVHELAELDGEAGYLREHLIHYNYDSLAHFKEKQGRYSEFETKILRAKGVRPKPWTYLTMPLREFKRRYISLHGYRDGWLGLQLCGLMGWYTFKTYRQLRR